MIAALLLQAALAQAQSAGPVAGGVVSSKEWTIRRSTSGKEEEFTGDVRYRSGPTLFTADWALLKHATMLWRARGRVHVVHALEGGDTIDGQGDEATLRQQTGEGRLTGKQGVRFLRTPAGGEPDQSRADRLEWYGKSKVSAVGAVHTWGPRLEDWADRADYDNAAGKLTLTGGRPVVLKLPGFDEANSDWIAAMQGDVVTASRHPRRLTADGKSRGWLEFTERRRPKEPREE